MADITDIISAALIKQDSVSSLVSDLWFAADNGLVQQELKKLENEYLPKPKRGR